MSSPCASTGPAQRYPCLHPACKPISQGTHRDWQRCEGACLPHHTARGRHPHRTARVCMSPLPWIGRLKDRHIQSCRCQSLLLPTPSVAPASMPAACGLTRGGVPIRVQCPSVRGGRRRASSAHHSVLGLGWPSTWLRSPCMGGEPSFCHLFHRTGSPSLLGCTSHQLAQGIGLPYIHDWNIMDWVLSPSPQPLAVGGSNHSPPRLHQRKEANGKVGRARDPL